MRDLLPSSSQHPCQRGALTPCCCRPAWCLPNPTCFLPTPPPT